jgi:hypothetical protein
MLGNPRVATRLPAEDLDRARALYYEKLGLNSVEQRKGSFSHGHTCKYRP